jgi:peptidoglycan/LPS O-acetylase OafA/YrhL
MASPPRPSSTEWRARPVSSANDHAPRFAAQGHRGRPDGDGFRPDIEGLRALAVLLVVAYHARVPGFGGGFVGVDVFFVLSGYLITGLLLRELRLVGTISVPSF